MSSALSAMELVVSRVQRWRFEEQARVESRRDRDAVERTSMAHHGIKIAGTRPTSV